MLANDTDTANGSIVLFLVKRQGVVFGGFSGHDSVLMLASDALETGVGPNGDILGDSLDHPRFIRNPFIMPPA